MEYEKYESGVGDSVAGRVAVDVESCVAVGSGVSVNGGVAAGTDGTRAQATNTNNSKTVNHDLRFIGSPGGLLLYPSQAL